MSFLSRRQRSEREIQKKQSEKNILALKKSIDKIAASRVSDGKKPIEILEEFHHKKDTIKTSDKIVYIPSKKSVLDKRILDSESSATKKEILKKAAMVGTSYNKSGLQYDPSAEPSNKRGTDINHFDRNKNN